MFHTQFFEHWFFCAVYIWTGFKGSPELHYKAVYRKFCLWFSLILEPTLYKIRVGFLLLQTISRQTKPMGASLQGGIGENHLGKALLKTQIHFCVLMLNVWYMKYLRGNNWDINFLESNLVGFNLCFCQHWKNSTEISDSTHSLMLQSFKHVLKELNWELTNWNTKRTSYSCSSLPIPCWHWNIWLLKPPKIPWSISCVRLLCCCSPPWSLRRDMEPPAVCCFNPPSLPEFCSGFGKEMEIISRTHGTKALGDLFVEHTEEKFFTIDVGSDISRLYGNFQALWKFPGFMEAYSVYKVTQTGIPLVFMTYSLQQEFEEI